MLPPVSKNFALSNGASYIGCVRPVDNGWSQAANSIVDFSLNALTDVMGPDSTVPGWWGGAYTGVSNYMAGYGIRGGIACWGGGHGNGSQNAMFVLDMASRLFVRIKDSATAFVHNDVIAGQATSRIADSSTGWMFGDTGGTTVQVGEPFACHGYSQLLYIPASAVAGGSSMGHLVTMGRSTMPLDAGAGTNQDHIFPLGGPTSTKWAFNGAGQLDANVNNGCAFYDSLRNRTVAIPSAGNTFVWRDKSTGEKGSVTMSQTSESYYSIGFYIASKDLYAYARINSQTGLLILRFVHPVTGAVTTATSAGAPPNWTLFGDCPFAWNETWQELVMYRGNLNTIYRGALPANPLTQPIIWSPATFTGTARSIYDFPDAAPAFNRLQWDPDRLIYHWMPLTTAPTQSISIPAP